MSIPNNHFQFRPADASSLQGPQAKAYANSMKLKAEVEAAREASPKEVFVVGKPEQFAEVPGLTDWMTAKQTLSGSVSTSDGVQNFFQHDGKPGQQYKIANAVSGGMMGGLLGSMFIAESDVYSKGVRQDNGSTSYQTLVVDKTSGLMDYSEWEIPALPGLGSNAVPGQGEQASKSTEPATFAVLDTATGLFEADGGSGLLSASHDHGTHLVR